MPIIYDSIFDGSKLITRKDLCVLLNLDTSRADLNFTDTQIKRAFKNRALRFHPDRQAGYPVPIPKETCDILMNDINLAKQYMLGGDDNIPGKAFLETRTQTSPANWTALIILLLNTIKDSSSNIANFVRSLHVLGGNHKATLILSMFSKEQLNLRYINTYSEKLAYIRPFLEQFNGNILTTILRGVKYLADNSDQEQFTTNLMAFLTEQVGESDENAGLVNTIIFTLTKLKEILTDDFINQLQSIVNLYLANNSNQEQFNTDLNNLIRDHFGNTSDYGALISAFETTMSELKSISTENFNQQLQYVTHFWPHFIATVPTWKHLLEVFFNSLLLTATSIPKFFNALTVIIEVVWRQKGIMHSILSIPLLLLVAACLLPINIALQLSSSLFLIAIDATYQLAVNGLKFATSLLNLVFLLLPISNKILSHQLFHLFESLVNISIRLIVTIILKTLDAVFFILTNKNPFSSLLNNINSTLDSILNFLNPLIQKHQEENAIALSTNNHSPNLDRRRLTIAPEAAESRGFFASRDLPTNKDDVFLDELLDRIRTEIMESETVLAPRVNASNF